MIKMPVDYVQVQLCLLPLENCNGVNASSRDRLQNRVTPSSLRRDSKCTPLGGFITHLSLVMSELRRAPFAVDIGGGHSTVY